MRVQIQPFGQHRTRSDLRREGDGACRFIEALVATALDIPLAALRAHGRGSAPEALGRQTAMYLAHVTLGLNLTQVGARFGRDRSTAAHACSCVENRREDPRFERTIACLEAALHRWRQSLGGAGE